MFASLAALVMTAPIHSGINCIAFRPDSRVFATAGFDGTVLIWNAENGAFLRAHNTNLSLVRSVAYSPDGRYLAIGGSMSNDRQNNTVLLFEATGTNEVKSFRAGTSYVSGLSFSSDSKTLYRAGYDNRIVAITISNGATRTLATFPSDVYRMVGSSDGSLAAAGPEANPYFARVSNGRLPAPTRNMTDPMYDLSISESSKEAVFVSAQGHAYTLALGGTVAARVVFQPEVQFAHFHPRDSNRLLLGAGNKLFAYNRTTMESSDLGLELPGEVDWIASSRDQRSLAIGTQDGQVALYRVNQDLDLVTWLKRP